MACGLFVAQSLKSYGHFSDLGVEIAISHHVEKRRFFWGKTNTEIHGPNHTVWARPRLVNYGARFTIKVGWYCSPDPHDQAKISKNKSKWCISFNVSSKSKWENKLAAVRGDIRKAVHFYLGLVIGRDGHPDQSHAQELGQPLWGHYPVKE